MYIRKANHEDIEAIRLLVNRAYRGESSRVGWTTEADLLDGQRTDIEAIQEMVEAPGSLIFLLTDEDQLSACMHVKAVGGQLYLGMLTVEPGLQNKGFGKVLLKEAEQYAQKLKLDSIYMTVISKRSELIAWYERHGYQLTGKTEPFPAHDSRFGIPKEALEFVVLEKKIS